MGLAHRPLFQRYPMGLNRPKGKGCQSLSTKSRNQAHHKLNQKKAEASMPAVTRLSFDDSESKVIFS